VGVRIGTAGWSIPTALAGDFPDEGSHLERYARMFSAVEINSSFHRPHRRTTYERWATSVPADFRFSVKIPKTISHTARLIHVDELLAAFLKEVGGLGGKLDVLLLQLPPSFPYDPHVAAAFFARLRDTAHIACEPRHASWFTEDADACMADHKVARVVADPVVVPGGGEHAGGWTGLHYHRLHGSPRVYYSPYETPRLEALTDTIDDHAWIIFDNTGSGAATGNALTLRDLVARR
jgi:uncharacterized protein YecE (DUF72 family)